MVVVVVAVASLLALPALGALRIPSPALRAEVLEDAEGCDGKPPGPNDGTAGNDPRKVETSYGPCQLTSTDMACEGGPRGTIVPADRKACIIPFFSSCHGSPFERSASPALEWTGVSSLSHTFAITVKEEDSPNYHWIVYDIPGGMRSLKTGALDHGYAESAPLNKVSLSSPTTLKQGTNSFGETRYVGPCVEGNDFSTHNFTFTLYALDQSVGLTGAVSGEELEAAMVGKIVSKCKIVSSFGRPPPEEVSVKMPKGPLENMTFAQVTKLGQGGSVYENALKLKEATP